LDSDPQLLSVTPKNFREQLEVLRRLYNVARLRDWISEEGKSARLTVVVITFDDGYADNFHEALPLLREADCPATVFVTAGKIDDEEEFWWDELERLILLPESLPEELSLSIGSRSYRWEIESKCTDKRSIHNWHVLLKQEATARQAAYLGFVSFAAKSR
jgi:peptidoglycan/xylan/chitin deacetylase (PgdA/CDA1 family)